MADYKFIALWGLLSKIRQVRRGVTWSWVRILALRARRDEVDYGGENSQRSYSFSEFRNLFMPPINFSCRVLNHIRVVKTSLLSTPPLQTSVQRVNGESKLWL